MATLLLFAGLPLAFAQPREIPSRLAPTPLDSGPLENIGLSNDAVFAETVRVPDASWIRLKFDEVRLAGNEDDGTGSFLIITSLHDGYFQIMHASHVQQWQNTSAYFNGDAVRIELFASAGTGENRIVIQETIAGEPVIEDDADERTICGAVDDRILSNDPRVGRAMPVTCTAWLFNDENKCLLTAGHCAGASLQVMQFNVPLSTAGGATVSPPPQDQYPIDPASVQSLNGGVGNDWAYFGCFKNSNTNLTAAQAQGDYFILAPFAPPVSGQNIRITGNGGVSAPVSPTWNYVQKTHVGPYVSLTGNTVRYATDTTGGNSGSPIIDETTGLAIGIHTHAGCNSGGGSNQGTAIQHSGLQNALANPQGVCDDDIVSPTPDPMFFTIPPTPTSTTTVVMQCTEATDTGSPPVEYYFDYVSGAGGGIDSGWTTDRDYSNNGLTPNSVYNYRVRARDSNSPTPNVTAYSTTITAGMPIQTPTGVGFSNVTSTSMTVQALGTFTNVGFLQTGFYYELTPPDGSGANAWVTGAGAASVNLTGLVPCTEYTLRIKARNFQSDETPFTDAVAQFTIGCDCKLLGDIDGDGFVTGSDIAGFVRAKLGSPLETDNAGCADYKTETLDGDTALFTADLLAAP
ncbi:Fibronectin type III domain protein [Phycisphaerae bacterium RAS2]|nr:Fibronectin type III domain protein [Phycisphaerae bacterium RAS2]